jgi:hypothetical protein
MSTLRVTTLATQAGVEVYTAKAWVNFNGTGTVAIRASGNVSSITDNGTGTYTINFSTSFADANYSVVFGCATSFGVTSQVGASGSGSSPTTQTVSAVQITHRDAASPGSFLDVANQYVAVFR